MLLFLRLKQILKQKNIIKKSLIWLPPDKNILKNSLLQQFSSKENIFKNTCAKYLLKKI